MTKVLPATCEASVVKIEGKVIAGATILSEGVAASTGVAVIEDEKVSYVTSNASDIKEALNKVIDALTETKTALDQIGSALSTLDGKPQGTLTPVPTIGANITNIATAATKIQTAKTALNTLKGSLK